VTIVDKFLELLGDSFIDHGKVIIGSDDELFDCYYTRERSPEKNRRLVK
jgi:hypothetical protein